MLADSLSIVTYKNMRFIIMDAPTDSNVFFYLKELKRLKVSDVVRVCNPTYNFQIFVKEKIKVWDWPFHDGNPPPQHIITLWLNLVHNCFKQENSNGIAVHCVAGLGRAPVLVAIALINEGMKPEDAIELIRSNRPGAINSKQFLFLRKFKSKNQSLKNCVLI